MTNKNERLFKPQRGAGVHGDLNSKPIKTLGEAAENS